jgi:hypothetical protein
MFKYIVAHYKLTSLVCPSPEKKEKVILTVPSVFYILREARFHLLTILNQMADLRKTWYDLCVTGGRVQAVHFRCSLGGKNERLIWSPSSYIRLSVSTCKTSHCCFCWIFIKFSTEIL